MLKIFDTKKLKETILEDTDNIRKILEYIGCDRLTPHRNEYRCAKNCDDPNNTRVVVKFNDNLTSKIYDLVPISGDVFTLIMELKQCKLSEAMKICCNAIGIKYYNIKTNPQNNKPKRKAFGGFYNSIKKQTNKLTSTIQLKAHNENILSNFINKGNLMFAKDNINYEIQTEFDIMYDFITDRIVVPWRHHWTGEIIGIMGRYNSSAEYCTQHNISKWLPLKDLEFPKSQTIYGLYQNYKYILQQGRIYIGESEKFVLQAGSYGVRNTGSIGSHDISDVQREILLSLGVDIVTCMDNDIPDSFNTEQCKKLLTTSSLLGGKVGFAKTEGILEGKESPTDRGKEIWDRCIEDTNIKWVN
ncbi:DNA primase [Clostridium botulinum]|uniref:DNA primase n=2 Tax=Clostridium botulinum TaxID=1491 RepID=A0A9Q1ZBZ1_CLOBO|nr:DNA primase [Clostridium botulinum]AEB77273.1 putative DNA primase [Clostridium botulinum BKT015925]KLU74370.1 putative DNA primase [Clostridium botulinum V891]MCD3223600.1 DNA primase [Clostridium botulinum C/D]KEH96270.1 DNA primase [Clostridium botulinum C/D str. Sp77]KOA75707.1 DNA primase [Clostridium botulinum]